MRYFNPEKDSCSASRPSRGSTIRVFDVFTEHADCRAAAAATRCARAREGCRSFHGRFYGAPIFCCKTAQFCATLRETQTAETPSVGDAVQRSENTRTDKRFGCVSETSSTIARTASGGRELDPNASLLSPRRDSFDGFRPVARMQPALRGRETLHSDFSNDYLYFDRHPRGH